MYAKGVCIKEMKGQPKRYCNNNNEESKEGDHSSIAVV
jgi:hypothetical protein